MRNMNVIKGLSTLALGGVLLVGTTGCEDLGLCGLTEDDLGMGDAFVETTGYFLNVVARTDEALRDGDLTNDGTPTTIDGATVTLSNDTLLIDFGQNNVSTADGKLRRGAIRTYINGDYFVGGSSAGIQLMDYHVDDMPITGSITVSNDGQTSGKWQQSLVTNNFAIDTIYAYNCNLVMEWQSGYATQDSVMDDVFTLDGSIGGDDFITDIAFDAAFLSPMLYDRSCAYRVVEGEVEVSLTDGVSANDVLAVGVDFIDSDLCNNVIFLTASCDGTEVSFPRTFDGF